MKQQDRPMAPARILVVEDNEANRDLIHRRLARLGFEVVALTNGAEALEFLQHTVPDLILMDLEMPVMSGFGAMQSIRSDALCPLTPVIALTAHATAEIAARCKAEGFTEFVTKPIDFKALVATIRDHGRQDPATGEVA